MKEFVDLNKIDKLNKIEIKVNGVKTPLSIGDKIQINSEDPVIKTVVAVNVTEDGRIAYILEWIDMTGEFKQESVSLTELKLLNLNARHRASVGLTSSC